MPRVCVQCDRRFDSEVVYCPFDGAPTTRVEQDDLVGRTIEGRYEILELLGAGGMGAVYRARRSSMNRDVAIKVIRSGLAGDPAYAKWFYREAQVTSRLADPHTITVFDFGRTGDDRLWLAMELLRGTPLSRVLEGLGGPMDPMRACRIADQVLQALVEAHEAGILHRDIKPDNVFVVQTATGEDFVKVLDFGIAQEVGTTSSPLTTEGKVVGTPPYVSPEQAQGFTLDARSDLYMVGVLLFEMLARRLPFTGEDRQSILEDKVYGRPPALEEVAPGARVPAAVEALVRRLLDPDPGHRPRDARNARALLREAMNATRPAVPRGRSRGTTWIGAAILAILAGVAAFVLLSEGDSPAPASLDVPVGPAAVPGVPDAFLARPGEDARVVPDSIGGAAPPLGEAPPVVLSPVPKKGSKPAVTPSRPADRPAGPDLDLDLPLKHR